MVRGVHCVLFALFDATGRLDRALMRDQAAWARESGAEGIVILGLATEVWKLSHPERLDLLAWAAEDAGGRPLAVTVPAAPVPLQREILRAAGGAGASLAILQPPEGEGAPLDLLLRAAEGASLPLALQHAPAWLGRSLDARGLAALRESLPSLAAVKAELPAVDLAALIEDAGGLAVLSGRGGLELTDSLRAGVAGVVVAPDVLPGVRACWDAWSRGDEAGAEAAYAAFLPAALFGMQSLDHLAAYGKRVWAARAGVSVHDRAPGLAPTEAGLRLARRWAAVSPPGSARGRPAPP